MCSTKRSPRNLGRLVLLACLAGVLGFFVPGCSGRGRDATVTPEARAKAIENRKIRFNNFDEKKKVSKPLR